MHTGFKESAHLGISGETDTITSGNSPKRVLDQFRAPTNFYEVCQIIFHKYYSYLNGAQGENHSVAL